MPRFSSFDPENPSWFVSRRVGIGWDLNLGKLAVAAGLIRPDDSLPDLQEHVPTGVSKALTWGPVAGVGILAVVGHFVGIRDGQLPTRWGLDLRPGRLVAARPAAAIPVFVSLGFTALTLVDAYRHGSVDASLSAQSLGIQAFSLATLAELARYTEGDESPAWGIGLGMIAIPATALGVLVGTVKAALESINQDTLQQ